MSADGPVERAAEFYERAHETWNRDFDMPRAPTSEQYAVAFSLPVHIKINTIVSDMREATITSLDLYADETCLLADDVDLEDLPLDVQDDIYAALHQAMTGVAP